MANGTDWRRLEELRMLEDILDGSFKNRAALIVRRVGVVDNDGLALMLVWLVEGFVVRGVVATMVRVVIVAVDGIELPQGEPIRKFVVVVKVLVEGISIEGLLCCCGSALKNGQDQVPGNVCQSIWGKDFGEVNWFVLFAVLEIVVGHGGETSV